MSPYEVISSAATQGSGPNYTAETSSAEIAVLSANFLTHYRLNTHDKSIKIT